MNRHLLKMVLIIGSVICIGACMQQTTDKTTDTTETPALHDTVAETNLPTRTFTSLDAESLIGKYYNQQNQLAKYAYYKTVATKNISIDSAYHKDTILMTVSSYGRIWENPNKDTLTTPFAKDVILKVYRYKQIWWADKLQAPDDVNLISEPVKK
jgi:hypothetical protein